MRGLDSFFSRRKQFACRVQTFKRSSGTRCRFAILPLSISALDYYNLNVIKATMLRTFYAKRRRNWTRVQGDIWIKGLEDCNHKSDRMVPHLGLIQISIKKGMIQITRSTWIAVQKQKPYNVPDTGGGAFGRMGEKKRARGDRRGKGLREVRNN